jgi:hypothetical protein
MRPYRDQHAYNARYYAAHRSEEIARVRQRHAATNEFLAAHRCFPCDDCGGSFASYQMDFDHRDPSTKSFTISRGEGLLASRERLLKEMDKCDVVCANCHRLRTYAAFMDGTLRPPGFRRKTEPAATPELQRRRVAWRERRTAGQQFLERLRELPCADCGRRYPPCVMEFDHRDPSEKSYLVSQMPGRVAFRRILEEIAKCDIVCANCHRKRTHLRRRNAGVAQLVEHEFSKLGVAGSRPVSRSGSSQQLRLVEEKRARYAA